MIGWQAIVASGGFLCARLIRGLIVLSHPSYEPQAWQLVLLYRAALVCAILVNTVISRLLPTIEGFILVLHTCGFFAILIPLIYFAPRISVSNVFTSFSNEGNWPTQGLSFMVGIVGSVFAFLGKAL